jgi:hypothetical protein
MHRDHIGSPIYIRCGEAEQTKAGAHEAVLAAIVINQPIAMVAAVVFDCKALKGIKQIWAGYETALMVMDRNLNPRPWEAGEHEEHSEPGLHGGLGPRLGQVNNAPKPSDALGSRMLGEVDAQFGDGNQPCMKDEVHSDHPFRQWISSSKVDRGTER